jgi:hypothetical protein
MTYLNQPATCTCGFTTRDMALLSSHSCQIQEQGGRCEDFPCCGHEFGDCNGQLYGSDEAIKASVIGHLYCSHEDGVWECEDDDAGDECDYEDHECVDCDHKSDGWQCAYCERPCPKGAHQD